MALPINIDEVLNGHTVEWERIELKKGWNPVDIIHSLCAFANDLNNWDGGYIIIGVEEENGKAKLPPIGLNSEQLDAIQKKLIELSYKITPTYVPVFQPYLKDEKHILVICAPAGDNRPYKAPISLSEKKSGKAMYIKRGSKTIKVKDGSDDERRLIELTARIPFDDRINQSANLDELNLQLIQSHLKEIMSTLYQESTKISFSDLCKHMRIVKGSNELFRPTNAGLLFFSEQPEKFFAGAKIEVVIHKHEVGKDYIEKIFTGPIVRQLRDVLSYIKNNIIQEQVLKTSKNAEAIRFYNYPYQAIEEAVVNAVYHKSYERENPVEIQIHSDKIEILSFPGPLPPVNKEMLKKERVVAREYRNRKIGGFLKELKLTEGRGTGLPIIHLSLERNGSPPPVFETDDDLSYFLSVLKIHPLAKESVLQEKRVPYNDLIDSSKQKINSIADINADLRLLSSEKRDKDSDMLNKVLDAIFNHLRLLGSGTGDMDNEQDDYFTYQALETIVSWAKKINFKRIDELYSLLKPYIEQTGINILNFCIEAHSRESVFEKIQLYNNTKNFNRHIRPLIANGWLLLTIPDKPSSKNQQYITSEMGKVILKNDFLFIDRKHVSSSTITSVGYDNKKQILEIEFHHGAIYQYFDVPNEVCKEFVNASSVGSYYFNEIKEKFKSKKV